MSERPRIVSAPQRGERLQTTDGPGVTLGQEIGRGGQGAVFAVDGDPHHCVKVYFEPDEAKADALRRRFDRLRGKNATPDPRLVLPTAVLSAPTTGYVMHRVTDADPLSARALVPRGEPLMEWFARTGSLRGRLLVAYELVRAFRDLHLRGLSFGDLSWENVLVPRGGRAAVHLIDCDNLSVDGVPPPAILGTPWFIAPEVLQGTHPPDALSDQHSLAVLLYYILVLTHPLRGDAIDAGSPDEEQEALKGHWPGTRDPLPWIDHETDTRNRSRSGLPRDMALSRLMKDLFRRSFENGLLGPDRARRPTEGAWLGALGRALDATVGCVRCNHTFYLSATTCPWCQARRQVPWVLMCAHGDGRRPVVVQQQRRLYARHLQFGGKVGDESELARVNLEPGGLTLETRVPLKHKRGSTEQLLHADAQVRLQAGDCFQLPQNGALVEVTTNEVR